VRILRASISCAFVPNFENDDGSRYWDLGVTSVVLTRMSTFIYPRYQLFSTLMYSLAIG